MSKLSFETLDFRMDEGILELRINRPSQRNSLNLKAMLELQSAFRMADGDEGVRLIILCGQAASWCTGVDPVHLADIAHLPVNDQLVDSSQLIDVLLSVQQVRKPVIAAIEGQVRNEGVGLAAVADIAIAAQGSTYACLEVTQHSMPALQAVFLQQRVNGAMARRMLLTGLELTADQALAAGLVAETCPAGQAETTAWKLARTLLERCDPGAMELTKRFLKDTAALPQREALIFATKMMAHLRSTPAYKNAVEERSKE